MAYTSILDILPLMTEAENRVKQEQSAQQQARQQYEMERLTNFKGYNPNAKEGLLDKLIPWKTANEKSVEANKIIDEIMQSNFGNYEYYKPTYDTKPLGGVKSGIQGIVDSYEPTKNVLSQMASDVYGGIKNSGKLDNGNREVNYNYYAGKYPKQKGESDDAYIERLRQISLTE